MCPELTAAIVTGDIAYKKAAGTEIQLLEVNFFRRVKHDHIIKIGASKKNAVIKN